MTSSGDSYTLREVAELLGVSKRTLQRRIREGAFPGRFLAPGRHGLEMRIPASDVQRALEDLRRGREPPPSPTIGATGLPARLATVTPARELEESAMIASPPSALTQTDLESLRDAMIAIVREDRESFLGTLRDGLAARDREVAALRAQIAAVQTAVDRLRRRLGPGERRREAQAWPDPTAIELPPAPAPTQDLDAILREIEAIEALVASVRS